MAWQDLRQNPHCIEVNLNGMEYHIDPPFARTLTSDMPRKPYRETPELVRTTIHWGQRKLLLSEIEFLTLVGREQLQDATVVYAGAAPGTHIALLAELFPFVWFVLVDPAPFAQVIKSHPRISICQCMFTDELARDLVRRFPKIFFISDIRSADPRRDGNRVEAKVQRDMEDQQRWHELLCSKRSLLKFRLPWQDVTVNYLDGDVHLPVWGPQRTTECRLITNPAEPLRTKQYDCKQYEEQMFHFNTVIRHSLFSHSVVCRGLDHCYDCRAEVDILQKYIAAIDPRRDLPGLIEEIGHKIAKDRTLEDPTPDREERLAVIDRKQRPNGRAAYEDPRRRQGRFF